MPILGAHMSISGGPYRAVELAADAGCDCVQLFSKSPNRWQARALTESDAEKFRDAICRLGITHPLIHDSYLVNLATPDDSLWRKSIDAMHDEFLRAELLGVPYIVLHPGSYTSSDVASGIRRVASALDIIFDRLGPEFPVQPLLETTAGQGTNLGRTFEQLAEMIEQTIDSGRIGICVDTCHIFAAGYDLRTESVYHETFDRFDSLLGIGLIRAFHLNDTKNPLESHVDRHEQIGEGHLGVQPFRLLINDPRFKQTPMYLETPKVEGYRNGRSSDLHNLALLRSLEK